MVKKNKTIILMLAAGVILAGAGATLLSSADALEGKSQERIYPVRTERVIRENFTPQGSYGGFVKGINQAMVAPKINGRIIAINKNEGDRVKKGEIITVLNADEIVTQAESASDMIASLGKTLKETEKYYKQKVDEAKDDNSSDEAIRSAKRLKDLQVQSVRNSIDEARGSWRVAQSLAKETSVRAPFDGVLVRMMGERGQLVGPTNPVFEIADNASREIELWIPQKIGQYLSPQDTLVIFSVSDDGSRVEETGIINSVGVGSESGLQKIRLQIRLGEPSAFTLGQYVSVVLPMAEEKKEAISISQEAIIHKYDEAFVWVAEDNKAKRRKIILGDNFGGKIEIRSGLDSDDIVIVEGHHNMVENNVVKNYE